MAIPPVGAMTYSAGLEQGQWRTDSSALECRLTHPIPSFGEAVISRRAGESLDFYLQPYRGLLPPGEALLSVEAPSWKPQKAGYFLTRLQVDEQQLPVRVAQPYAETLVQALLQGMMPTLVRADAEAAALPNIVKVAVSAVNFRSAYEQYGQCLAQLLPVSFEQVARSAIFYNSGTLDFGRDVEQQLELILRFMQNDSRISRLYIDGHTDNTGTREENILVSRQRAEKVRDYFLANGIAAERIVTRFHADIYPALANDLAENRARNRRVTLRLERE